MYKIGTNLYQRWVSENSGIFLYPEYDKDLSENLIPSFLGQALTHKSFSISDFKKQEEVVSLQQRFNSHQERLLHGRKEFSPLDKSF